MAAIWPIWRTSSRPRSLIRDGLMSDEDGVLTIAERGRPFVRAVCAVFDAHLEAGAQRHSKVV